MTPPQGRDQAHAGPGGAKVMDGPGPGYAAEPPRNGLGVAALTLALIGAVLFWTVLGGLLLGLLAVLLGIFGARRAKRGQATNGTMAIVGAVIGALALIASSVILAIGLSVVRSDDFKTLENCVKHADTKSAQQKCRDDFSNSVLK